LNFEEGKKKRMTLDLRVFSIVTEFEMKIPTKIIY